MSLEEAERRNLEYGERMEKMVAKGKVHKRNSKEVSPASPENCL